MHMTSTPLPAWCDPTMQGDSQQRWIIAIIRRQQDLHFPYHPLLHPYYLLRPFPRIGGRAGFHDWGLISILWLPWYWVRASGLLNSAVILDSRWRYALEPRGCHCLHQQPDENIVPCNILWFLAWESTIEHCTVCTVYVPYIHIFWIIRLCRHIMVPAKFKDE